MAVSGASSDQPRRAIRLRGVRLRGELFHGVYLRLAQATKGLADLNWFQGTVVEIMAHKRSAPSAEAVEDGTGVKRARKGFSVGSANLPDGTHRRKGRLGRQQRIQGLMQRQYKR